MLTVKREDLTERTSGNTALLERESVSSRETTSTNLEKLLNYGRCPVSEPETVSTEFTAPKEEDITPSSTTMQFQGQASAERFYGDHVNEEKFSFSLNAKGKILIGIYAAVVALIVAAIIIITGVNRSLSQAIAVKSQEVNDLKTEYSQIVDEIKQVTSNDYIANEAENIGMVNGK